MHPQEQLAAATAAGDVLTGKKASLQRERKLLQRLAACEEELRQLRRQASPPFEPEPCPLCCTGCTRAAAHRLTFCRATT